MNIVKGFDSLGGSRTPSGDHRGDHLNADYRPACRTWPQRLRIYAACSGLKMRLASPREFEPSYA